MLKDSEDLVRRRKLSSFSTPPTTPPNPPHLNMMMASALNMSATPTTTSTPILNVPQTTALALTASTPTSSNGPAMPNPAHLPAHMAAAAAAAAAAIEQLSQQQHHKHLNPTQTMPINIPHPPAAAHHVQSTASATAIPPSTAMAASALMPATSASLVQDHYSLRWNNHQNHILRAFDALLQTKTLVDVTLVSADTSIRAHKMVLSACSPFFQRVFADTPCKHPVIVLKDFPGWVVQAIVDFMYRGEISVQQERLQSLIQAGESLQIRGLVESSVPEHSPTPAASPDEFAMALDTSMLSSELERCSSFDCDESPSMVTAGSKVMLPSRLFGSVASRRERKREREIERDMDSDHELNSDMCTSPMPRRKQARPRRRSSDVPLEMPSKPSTPEPPPHQSVEACHEQPLALEKEKPQTPQRHMEEQQQQQQQIDPAKTIIKREMLDAMDDRGDDSGNADPDDRRDDSESREQAENGHQKSLNFSNEPRLSNTPHGVVQQDHHNEGDDDREHDDDDDDDDNERELDDDDEELMNSTLHMRRRKSLNDGAMSDGPEDLCTTKKDNDTSGVHSMSDSEGSPTNNNNNCKLNNNNRIVLSLKDIRQLNKPSSSSTPNSANNMNPFSAASLRDLRMDRAAEQQCKMEVLEAQMHAAAAAAACAAANGENPFQHMEHQMDLSLAAAAAAAAVSHQHSRERDQAMQREQREFHQHQQNAYANSLLGQMAGMPGMPGPFGPGGGGSCGPGSGPAPHERLEESMNRLSKDFPPSSPLSLPSHFGGPDGGPPHPPSPLPFPGMSSALTLTPPHMFGLDSPLGLFPPGIDPGKLYNPLMEMSDPRGMGPDPPPFLKKKMPRPKGQHSAPRGGPPRSWTNAELTEALQHVWNKKMTTSQASRIFGIPYNSLLMYVRGKYGKSLKLEQLRKDCISGPPLELLQMGMSGSSSSKNNNNSSRTDANNTSGATNNNNSNNNSGNNNNNNGSNPSNPTNASNSTSGGASGGGGASEPRDARKADHHRGGSSSADMDLSIPPPLPGMGSLGGSSGPRSASSEPDLLGGPNSLFNPFPQGFYPDFASGFPGLPLSMLNLLPPSERHQHAAMAAAMHHLGMDEDCKSVGSKQSSSMDDEFAGAMQPLALSRDEAAARRTSDLLLAGMPAAPTAAASSASVGSNGGVGGQD